ncbi:LptF/LptG family permease [Wenyingzhuangia sp. 2_MG-2023]|uniref:LptF/LptG family permease n=1 Tax=Wenyingzhuangia sp. 2_MG-2023 TaxID=3062639 RepID=UPI0026E443FE|nr:LptF/LptG family permease [Wenyingzhuangia sp. 2_MG-2023]MDO6737323.1 LptF/LptG family permease [Wenyingzhuangia sp. 2_MG-2023]
MKTLDKYLVKSFLIPFSASFLIVMFVLVMQALWLVFDDIAGKGIEIVIIFKFLWYMCLFVTPQALPISVLLSAIMTMGNLGENYELAAIKSSGISFFRFLRPLMITVGIISIANFFLINYTYPYASLKQKNLILNIKKTQPTMALIEGSFNDEIPGYSIKFAKKYGEENNLLKDVLIIDTDGNKDDHINITAKRGKITTEEGSKYMTLILEDGYYFEDHTSAKQKRKDKEQMPASMAKFEKYTVNIDISDLTSADLEEEKYKYHYTMKNMGQLQASSDSLKASYDNYVDLKYKSMKAQILADKMSEPIDSTIVKTINPNILENFETVMQINILQQAENTANSKLSNIQSYKDYFKRKRKELNNHDYQFHFILTSSISCLLLFFVGASLGSIIRKGGFGFPMVIAIVIYVAYHFTNTFGKNMAEESSITAIMGGWLGTLIMSPLAIFFTISASKDRGFLNFGVILTPFKKLINRLKKKDE